MKKNRTNTTSTCKLLLLFALLFVGGYSAGAHAEVKRNTLATVVAEPTGAGVVYASEKENASTGMTAISYEGVVDPSTLWHGNSKSAYLYAVPDSGYTFGCWTGNGRSEDNVLYSRQARPRFLLTHDNTTDSLYRFTAHFARTGALTAASADEALGTVGVDSISNRLGDTVTLTAYPDMFAGRFAGWADVDGNIVSTENPLTVVVTDTVKYKAMFDSVDMQSTGFYARLVPVDADGRHDGWAMGLSGVSEMHMDSLYSGLAFSNSLIIGGGERMLSSPAFVVRLTGTPDHYGGLSSLDGSVQGHKLSDILGSAAEGTTLGLAKINEYGKALYMKNGDSLAYLANGKYAAQAAEEGFDSVSAPVLLGKQVETDGFRWEVVPITGGGTDDCFGAWPQSEKKLDGHYFTTMYTAFPYQCLDGVEAYVVTAIRENGELEMKKIETGIVPKNTAVILACLTREPAQNRLLPLLDETQEPIDGNLLKGEIWVRDALNGRTDSTFHTFRTAFDAGSMRVMNDNLDFGKDFDGTYLPNNAVYLDISGHTQKLDCYRMPDGIATGVNAVRPGNEGRGDDRIYNIKGQYVGGNFDVLPQGIYIRNGKKVAK